MRAFACGLAISLAWPAQAARPPQRVASLNLCTDELVLALAAPGQIASVTHLAQDPAEFSLWREARRYPRNDGSLLSVAPMRPDLVVTMSGAGRDPAGIATRLGVPVLVLPFPQSLADLKAGISRVAAALGRRGQGARIVARIDALERNAPKARDAIWLGGGGQTIGAQGLGAEWMGLAGLRQRALAGDRVSLEQLLVHPPAVLLRSDYRAGQYSASQRWLAHPLAAHVAKARQLTTDGRLWTCMGPNLIPEIERLRG